jgi:hypothetical protein
VFGWVRRRAENAGLRDGQCGAITVIQRFGGALNLNVHFHSLVLDGVFTRARPTAAPVFQAQPAPTDAEVADVLDQVYRRVRRVLHRRGRWPEEDSSASDPVAEQLPLLAEYAAASIQGLMASGPRGASRAPAPIGGRYGGRRQAAVRASGGILAARERGRAGARAGT